MNILLSISLLLLLATVPASGQMLSDKTGLLYRLDIETGGHMFEVETVSNFDVRDYSFDKDQKRLTLHIFSALENNLGEIIIPQNFLSGNLTVYLNDHEFHPKISSNDKISFITLNFTGSGNNRIDIFGDTYLGKDEVPQNAGPVPENGGGCLIATAAYGSELAPQVQLLREIRDIKVMSATSGATFMSGFNQLYYLISPYVADYQRENPVFKELVRMAITPLVASLGIMSMADSEQEILVYGIAVILMNAGMYLAAPTVICVHLRKLATR